MKFQRFLFILLLHITFIAGIRSQCVPVIGASSDCETAPVICLDQLCFTTQDIPLFCCMNWCGNNTVINNPQYFLFLPDSSDVDIAIHVDDCDKGSGLQSGILDACPWENNNLLDCDPGTNPGATMTLHAHDLLPGSSYWLILDGSNGATCHYTITSTSGISFPELSDTLDSTLSFPSANTVCPGYENLVLYTGPDIPGASYQWTLAWSGEVLLTNEPSLTVNVDVNSPTGIWNVCVQALNNCDTTASLCFQVEIENLPPVIKDSTIFCWSDFPFQWLGQIITGPGDYTATVADEHSCSVDSIWKILQYPIYPNGIIDTFICSHEFSYHGQVFDHSGQYTVVLAGENSNGCDSLVDLNVTLGAPDHFVELVCENDQLILASHIIVQDESIDTVTFQWYSCSFDSLLTTEPDLIPTANGCYNLVIHSSVCADTLTSSYNNSPCLFNDECYFTTSPTCAGASSLLTPVFEVPSGTLIHWLIDYPGEQHSYAGDADSIYVTFAEAGTYPVSFTLQDSLQTWTCHANMVVHTGPEVSMCCDMETCDSCIVLVLTNHSDDDAQINLWNGMTTGAFGHGTMNVQLCFPELPDSIGIAEVLSTQNGCEGSVIGDTVITFTPLPRPLVFIVPFTDTLCSYPNDLESYKWRYCDSTEILSTATCFAPPASGCYCLEVENESGCTYETCMPFILNGTSTITEDQLQFSPNPTSGMVHIELQHSIDLPVGWQLTDASGKTFLDGKISERICDLNLDPVAKGLYFLKFDCKEKGILTRKIVIE